ncbi:unnamed protein product [Microthlaspi erraticum]|uniref:Uncharacterized protein n=1 Tax=Microthlaspi erraticum TaxID=1685480 RepID=A0A6D2KG74_9BRAS|nr:unnamed protein product [Microthlaspi erraticum]
MMNPPLPSKTLIPFRFPVKAISICLSLLYSRFRTHRLRRPQLAAPSIELSRKLSPPPPVMSPLKISSSIALSNSPPFFSSLLNDVTGSEPPFTIPIPGLSLKTSPLRLKQLHY